MNLFINIQLINYIDFFIMQDYVLSKLLKIDFLSKAIKKIDALFKYSLRCLDV